MTTDQLMDIKKEIARQVQKARSIDFRFWGGIIILLLVVIFWGTLMNFEKTQKEIKRKIDPRSFSWDGVYDVFVAKYEYEKSLFADVESRNIVLKSAIDDLYYMLHKDDNYYTYQQKADIIRRDLERRLRCPCKDE